MNGAADALSRIDHEVELKEISMPVWVEWDEIKKAVARDPRLLSIIKVLSAPGGSYGNYSLHNGLLLYKDRVVIPQNSPGYEP